ncbi:hypothetical protein M0654_03680 [Rhizobium sp. NTR19]|uniref:Ig-like domain-containing protein n=1 Tax=Neorhizobium turbinariae TaxID=2937795 RepID=A0ABT0IMH5_9HYPH|nr:hypothetical protein [Neorhizobium turbinariae]MCK8779080.1 hypothetical protein [Neorhizobium turbinariae]
MVGQIQRTRGKAAYRRAADAAGKKPKNTVLPAITGTPTEGETLTCSTGTWTNTPDAYAYQWLRAGVPIAGATASTRVLDAADVGSAMSCTVTATNEGVSTSATSAPTAVVEADE